MRKTKPKSSSDLTAPLNPTRRAALKKLLALGALATFDIGALSSCARKSLPLAKRERKVLVLGLDGLDARLVERGLAEGKLPHLSRLRERGGYSRLLSSVPPQSPTAWASVITGTNPGKHGIFDFIQRDPQTYLPHLSIARTETSGRALSLGDWKIPLSGAQVQSSREGKAFWEHLCAQGVPCSIYRIPTNFPPRATGAQELAGLGAPDLRGTYGEFSYYTDAPSVEQDISGGTVERVTVWNNHIRARLVGPVNTLRQEYSESSADFDIWLDRAHKLAKIAVQGQELLLREGEWSEWVPVQFEMIPHLNNMNVCVNLCFS